jgi:serine/threonine-protein kinase
MPLKTDDRFGRYEIRHELGRGGMGIVFRAHDTVLGRDVALKVMDEGARPGQGANVTRANVTRLMREARAAAAVSHPNAVAIFDIGDVGDVAYIAMELIEGTTLRAFIGDATVPVARRVRWLLEAARALAAAHARGIVHRDVKPENIMVRADGIVKVLDFGIARIDRGAALPHEAGTLPGAVVGTLRYMAPEQMRGEAIDARADQFAWGVVADELLTGTLPWGEHAGGFRGLGDMMIRAPEPVASRNPEVDPRVSDAIGTALAVSASARFAAMVDLIDAIDPSPHGSVAPPAPERRQPVDALAKTTPSNALPPPAAAAPRVDETLPPSESLSFARGPTGAGSLPPTIAGRYVPRRLLGRGGMGAVYEVEHAHTGERWALKVLHEHVALDTAAIDRFRREARVAGQIRSDHVVRVIDADVAPELGGAPYMVMDLLEGATLADIADGGPQPASRVVGWLAQIAGALDRAHAQGIVHRDLKPANLFAARRIDGTSIVKILDFGVAKVAGLEGGQSTQGGTLIGTPLYMSPEQAGSDPTAVRGATDVWSIGILAFYMLTGRDYWGAGSIAQLLAKIIYEPVVAPSKRGSALGAGFDAWFLRSCARDPSARWPTVTAQIDALAAALDVDIDAAVREAQGAPAPVTASANDRRAPSLAGPNVSLAGAASSQSRHEAPEPPRRRPAIVVVVGAIAGACILAFVALRGANDAAPIDAKGAASASSSPPASDAAAPVSAIAAPSADDAPIPPPTASSIPSPPRRPSPPARPIRPPVLAPLDGGQPPEAAPAPPPRRPTDPLADPH